MKKNLDLQQWARKDQFHFFQQFEEPFFSVCIEIDCRKAYAVAKEQQLSFFLYYLHKSLAAANATEPFRYRIADQQVWIYETVHASPTINRPDGTFGFSYIDYHADLQQFIAAAEIEIAKVQNSSGLIAAVSGENVIHYSSVPWINFTSVSHARCFSFKDSSPKITFGKMTEEDGPRKMPVSIHVHHALMDGYHVGKFIDLFQQLMNE